MLPMFSTVLRCMLRVLRTVLWVKKYFHLLNWKKIFGLTGGNIFHGAMSLDQLYMTRPTAGHVSPATPVGNLLLCGSGAHPGGGVMGAPGRIAAVRTAQILGRHWKF